MPHFNYFPAFQIGTNVWRNRSASLVRGEGQCPNLIPFLPQHHGHVCEHPHLFRCSSRLLVTCNCPCPEVNTTLQKCFKLAMHKVPVLSVVENMAYFDCSNGERHRPFGPGHARELVEECGLASGCVFSLPLSPAVARGSDCGDPVSLSSPDGEEAKVPYYRKGCVWQRR